MRPQLIIAGGGLMGRLCALALSEPNLWPATPRIRLLEQGNFSPNTAAFQNAAAHVAAAMLAPLAESVLLDSSLVDLAYRSIALWHNLQQQLPDFALQQRGSILLAHPQQQHLLQHFVSQIKHHAQYQPQWLNKTELAALEPALADRFLHSCLLPAEGQLDNQAFMSLSLQLLKQRGVSLEAQSQVDMQGNQLRCNGKLQSADLIIDCRGLGAKPQISALRAVRGEVLRVRSTAVKLSRPVRLLHPRYALYIAPKPNNIFVIGATELESNEQTAPSVRSALELLSALYAIDPAFAEAEILSLQASARPALPDNKPNLIQQPGMIRVNGLHRHGFLLGPALAEQVAQAAIAQLQHKEAAQCAPMPGLLKGVNQ